MRSKLVTDVSRLVISRDGFRSCQTVSNQGTVFTANEIVQATTVRGDSVLESWMYIEPMVIWLIPIADPEHIAQR